MTDLCGKLELGLKANEPPYERLNDGPSSVLL
jgi:hypothetical protein